MTEDSKEVKVTYETLYELLRREKSKDELQKLDESFYRDVLEYLKEKTKMLQDAAGKFDMFSVEERETTQIQLSNIKKILKELYERREKKILDMALNKSKTNSNIIDTSNLLAKEHEMYNVAVKTLDSFRKDVLFSLLEMRAPVTAEFKEPAQPEPEPAPPVPQPEPSRPESEPAPEVNKIKVKFLEKVAQFVGKELETYGPFEPDSVAELPKEIADILVNKGSATVIS